MSRVGLASVAVILGLLLSPLAAPFSAEAVTINIGIGTNLSGGRWISCSQGERLLRSHGFRDIRRVSCSGHFFVYRGWRGGSRFEVSLRSRDGRVANIRRLGR